MFKRFKSNQSGVYTCSLVYKLTAEQPAKNLIMTYLIYAYSDSNYYYEFTAQYHAAPCNSIYNISFEKALLQARYLIEKFFEQQVEIMRKSSEPLPEIYYIEGTLQMVWVDRCYPGYGMNPLRHPDCPDCCVVCSPGSYNPSNRIHCLPCNNSFMYGATKC
nr:PREDICTED: zona pellucida-binding protein 1 isoform X1 [Struthio camelus australis]